MKLGCTDGPPLPATVFDRSKQPTLFRTADDLYDAWHGGYCLTLSEIAGDLGYVDPRSVAPFIGMVKKNYERHGWTIVTGSQEPVEYHFRKLA